MSFVLTTGSEIVCLHQGRMQLVGSQTKLLVGGNPALTIADIAGKAIVGCTFVPPPGGKPCTAAVSVIAGASTVLSVDGKPVLLDRATGVTDSVPPATWSVRGAMQTLFESG